MSKKSTLGGLAVLALALGCVTAGWGRDETTSRKNSEVPTAVPGFTLENHQLPYEGFGKVSILDDGFLLIQLGGEDIIDPETDEWIGAKPQDVVGLQVNTAQGWGLVQANRELFLDRQNAAETLRRNLKGDRTNRTTFRQGVTESDTIFVLHGLAGQMAFSMDAATGRLHLTLDDTEKSGLYLSVDEALGTAHGTVVAKSGAFNLDAPSDPAAEGPALLRVVTDPSALAAPATTHCSAGCSGGDCSISCTGRNCTANCDGATPVCRCTDRI